MGQGIIGALSRVAPGHSYFLIVPTGVGYEPLCDALPGADRYVYQPQGGKLGRLLFERRELPKLVRDARPDVILSLDMRGLLDPPCPQAVFPQDAHLFYPSRHYGREALRVRAVKAYDKRYLRRLLPAVDLLLCQTSIVERRIRERFGYGGEAMVCGSAVAPTLLAAPADMPMPPALQATRGKFRLLSIGRYYAHKNLEQIVELYRRHSDALRDVVVVLTIAADQHPNAAKFLRSIEQHGLRERIINVGPVPVEQVAAYYQHCDAMLMPTLLETFGLPYVEAMHFGRPILTSDLDFARHVCGDAAEFFDPWSTQSMLEAIQRVRSDTALRDRRVACGKQRLSADYPGWDTITSGIVSRLERLAANPRHN